jgi:hypothetical protein
MRIISLLLLLAAASVLDGTVTARLAIGPSASNAVMPDAFLVALVVWLLLNRGTWALAGACAMGLACDLSAASRLGIVTLSYCAAGVACGWADERWPQSKLARVGTRLAAALGVPLVLAVTLKMTGDVSAAWLTLGGRALAVGGFSLALALPVTLAIHWCSELWGREGSSHEYPTNRRATF